MVKSLIYIFYKKNPGIPHELSIAFQEDYKRGFPDRRFIAGCKALEKCSIPS
jgi:hypothetical protein